MWRRGGSSAIWRKAWTIGSKPSCTSQTGVLVWSSSSKHNRIEIGDRVDAVYCNPNRKSSEFKTWYPLSEPPAEMQPVHVKAGRTRAWHSVNSGLKVERRLGQLSLSPAVPGTCNKGVFCFTWRASTIYPYCSCFASQLCGGYQGEKTRQKMLETYKSKAWWHFDSTISFHSLLLFRLTFDLFSDLDGRVPSLSLSLSLCKLLREPLWIRQFENCPLYCENHYNFPFLGHWNHKE